MHFLADFVGDGGEGGEGGQAHFGFGDSGRDIAHGDGAGGALEQGGESGVFVQVGGIGFAGGHGAKGGDGGIGGQGAHFGRELGEVSAVDAEVEEADAGVAEVFGVSDGAGIRHEEAGVGLEERFGEVEVESAFRPPGHQYPEVQPIGGHAFGLDPLEGEAAASSGFPDQFHGQAGRLSVGAAEVKRRVATVPDTVGAGAVGSGIGGEQDTHAHQGGGEAGGGGDPYREAATSGEDIHTPHRAVQGPWHRG